MIAAIYAGRDRIHPRDGVRIEACRAPAMAKAHRCPAMSTRSCIVAQAATRPPLPLQLAADPEQKRGCQPNPPPP